MLHILKKNPIFKGLKEDELNAFISCHKPVIQTYEPKEVIFLRQSDLTYMGLVLVGKVELIKGDALGNETIIYSLGVSESFGEAVALTQDIRTAVDAIARDKSVIAFFNIEKLVTLCKNACDTHVKIQRNLLEVLAKKMIQLHRKLDVLSQRTIRERLLQYLYQVQMEKNNKLIEIPYSRQGLANYLNVDRSALSREITRMEQDGMITVSGKQFIIRI